MVDFETVDLHWHVDLSVDVTRPAYNLRARDQLYSSSVILLTRRDQEDSLLPGEYPLAPGRNGSAFLSQLLHPDESPSFTVHSPHMATGDLNSRYHILSSHS